PSAREVPRGRGPRGRAHGAPQPRLRPSRPKLCRLPVRARGARRGLARGGEAADLALVRRGAGADARPPPRRSRRLRREEATSPPSRPGGRSPRAGLGRRTPARTDTAHACVTGRPARVPALAQPLVAERLRKPLLQVLLGHDRGQVDGRVEGEEERLADHGHLGLRGHVEDDQRRPLPALDGEVRRFGVQLGEDGLERLLQLARLDGLVGLRDRELDLEQHAHVQILLVSSVAEPGRRLFHARPRVSTAPSCVRLQPADDVRARCESNQEDCRDVEPEGEAMPKTMLLVGTRKGCFLVESDDRRAWDVRGPFCEGWPVYHAVYDPASQTIYAAAASEWHGVAVWRSSDLGETWELSSEGLSHGDGGLRLSKISTIAAAHGRLLAGGEASGVFESRDGGRSWALKSTLDAHPAAKDWNDPSKQPPGHLGVSAIIPHAHEPARFWVIVQGYSLFETTDDGATWTPR